MAEIEISPARPMTEADRLERRARLLREAAYYQRLSAWHYELAQIMLDYNGFNSASFPYDQFVWAQMAQADLNRMARRVLFAALGI